MADLLVCTQQKFALQFGDLTAIGWLITALYMICVLGIIAMLRKLLPGMEEPDRHLYREFWLLLAAVYLFLGLNKQFDFQTIATDIGRCLSQLEGWYDERRRVQLTAVLVGMFGGILALFLLKWRYALISRNIRFAFLGLILSGAFVTSRAISFHHVDQLFSITMGNIKLHVVFEITGIVLVSLNAYRLSTRTMRRQLQRPGVSNFEREYVE
jgi:hypothetical protein